MQHTTSSAIIVIRWQVWIVSTSALGVISARTKHRWRKTALENVCDGKSASNGTEISQSANLKFVRFCTSSEMCTQAKFYAPLSIFHKFFKTVSVSDISGAVFNCLTPLCLEISNRF